MFLSLTHGEELHFVYSELRPLGEFEQIGSRVGSWTENENDRREWRALVPDGLKANRGRRDELFAHDSRHILGHGQIDSVHAETAQEHEFLEFV